MEKGLCINAIHYERPKVALESCEKRALQSKTRWVDSALRPRLPARKFLFKSRPENRKKYAKLDFPPIPTVGHFFPYFLGGTYFRTYFMWRRRYTPLVAVQGVATPPLRLFRSFECVAGVSRLHPSQTTLSHPVASWVVWTSESLSRSGRWSSHLRVLTPWTCFVC